MIRPFANAAVLACAALLCYLMQISKPQYIETVRTVPVTGRLGELVEGRFVRARAEKVEFARQLRVDQNRIDKTLTTGGLWAIVSLEVEAIEGPVALYRRTWSGQGGLAFDESTRIASGLPTDFTVGAARKGRLIFEILPDQARKAEVRISRDWLTEFDNELRIDLDGITLQPDGQPLIVETLDLRQPQGK